MKPNSYTLISYPCHVPCHLMFSHGVLIHLATALGQIFSFYLLGDGKYRHDSLIRDDWSSYHIHVPISTVWCSRQVDLEPSASNPVNGTMELLLRTYLGTFKANIVLNHFILILEGYVVMEQIRAFLFQRCCVWFRIDFLCNYVSGFGENYWISRVFCWACVLYTACILKRYWSRRQMDTFIR